MNNQELICLLREAQEKMEEAVSLLGAYVRASDDAHTDMYILAHLKIMTSENHGYLSHDKNMDDVIAEVENRGYDIDEYGDEYEYGLGDVGEYESEAALRRAERGGW